MRHLFLVLVLLAGCEMKPATVKPVNKEVPTVNLPVAIRQHNWLGSHQQGSCVWASTINLLRWQGHDQAADYVRQNYGDGEYPEDHAQKLDRAGIRYAYVTNGDVKFLEWCVKTRRGAGVTVMGGAHCVNLVHLDDIRAGLLDNNNPTTIIWVPRETFLAEWRASHGWAFTVVYTPCPPLPN
jgi:hypothetical protein